MKKGAGLLCFTFKLINSIVKSLFIWINFCIIYKKAMNYIIQSYPSETCF